MSTSYYRGAHGVLLVYDASSRASFASMDAWFDEVAANTVPGTVALYLVAAKIDKRPQRAVVAHDRRAQLSGVRPLPRHELAELQRLMHPGFGPPSLRIERE